MNPGQRHTNWRTHWVVSVKEGWVLVCPLSSQGRNRFPFQKSYKSRSNGLLKPSWLCLDSSYWVPLTKWGTLQRSTKVLGTFTQEESKSLLSELLKGWNRNPEWKPEEPV